MIARGPFDRWLRPEVPPERLARARTLVGAFALFYLLVRIRYFADLSVHGAGDFAPVGVARVLSAPLAAWSTTAIAGLAVALGVAFLARLRPNVVSPAFFAAMLWVTTYRSSFGKILHTENLLLLHLFVLALADAAPSAPAADDGAAGARGRRDGWTLRTMTVLTACAYLVAGVAKLRFGGEAWLSGGALADWIRWDALRKIELGSVSSPLGPRLAGMPEALRALAAFTIVVEIGAPLALLHPRLMRGWVLAAWLFHAGIAATMAIGFLYPLSLVAFAPAFPLERIRRWPLGRARGDQAWPSS